MFKKFTRETITGKAQPKRSVIRGIRKKLVTQFPAIEPYIDSIIPPKSPLLLVKCQSHVQLLVVNNEILFFQERDGPFCPTLRLYHQYPILLPRVQVDKGAIKFVMSGAHIMCRGITSAGGKIFEPFEKDTIVVILAEGKERALGIGLTKMSGVEIKGTNQGIGIDNVHYLGDGLWDCVTLEE